MPAVSIIHNLYLAVGLAGTCLFGKKKEKCYKCVSFLLIICLFPEIAVWCNFTKLMKMAFFLKKKANVVWILNTYLSANGGWMDNEQNN